MPFSEYAGSAFEPYILPIIPKGAKLSQHTSLTPDRIGKIPGMRYATDFDGNVLPLEQVGWAGFPKSRPWQESWQHPPLNKNFKRLFDVFDEWYSKDGFEPVIGMLGRIFPAVDFDIPDKSLADIAEAVADEVFGLTARRCRTGSDKLLRVYRIDQHNNPLFKMRKVWLSPFGVQFAIELLADGQQYLIEGPHPSGDHYIWPMGIDLLTWGVDNLPIITADQVNLFYQRCEEEFAKVGCKIVKGGGNARMSSADSAPRQEVGPLHSDLCPDLDMLRDVLTNYLPCTHVEFSTYDEWATACVAIVTACGRDESFYDFFLQWCMAFEGNTEEDVRGKWESVRESSIGWSYICQIAHEYGYTADVQMMMPALSDDPANPNQSAGPTPRMDGSYEGVIADEFVRRHGGIKWRYAPRGRSGDWYSFNGVWQPDTSALHDIALLSQSVGLNIRNSPSPSAADMRIARSMYTAHTAQAVESLVRHDPAVITPYASFDEEPMVLGVPGGYVDAEGRLRDPDPKMLITKRTAYRPDFSAKCPRFDEMICRLANFDPEIEAMYIDFLGYTLTGTCQEQAFMFMHGEQGNEGKTTFTQIIANVMGQYARSIKNTVFVKSREEQRFSMASLVGYRFIYSNEIERGQEWAGARLKEATGGGTMEIERKNAQAEEMRPTGTLWFTGNFLPTFPPSDYALRRREIVGQPRTPITAEEDVKGLAHKLAKEEGQAILARMVGAAQAYIRRGSLLVPASVRELVMQHSLENDPIWQFAQERLVITGAESDLLPRQRVFEEYDAWANHTARHKYPMGRNTFFRTFEAHTQLLKMGLTCVRKRLAPDAFSGMQRDLSPTPVYTGVRLVGAEEAAAVCVGKVDT